MAQSSNATPTTVTAMQWHRRILLIAASPEDPKAIRQRRILMGWLQQAADRDVSVVELSGDHVDGAGDSADSLRERYRLASGVFQALLIGKDGHVALRSTDPIDAGTLQQAIDAMPMRRAGGR